MEAVFARFASSPEGLAEADVRERLRHDGPNVLSEAAPPRLVARLRRHLGHRFALLLWTGAGLALLGERFSPGQGMGLIAAALVVVVLVNALFGFWQETRVERAMSAFRRMLAPRARTLRDGGERDVDARELVPGDVILLRQGDRVAADARLFAVSGLKVDNSPLTGECEPQLRTTQLAGGTRLESRNLVFSGTLVTTGTGSALVYATGDGTEIGRIARVTQLTTRVSTPIRRELDHFVRVITRIALGLGAAFFAAGWALGNPFWTNLVFAIGILVANIPEGLLPTLTLALAIAGRRMAKRHALVKTLESAETLGCTTVICTDKTGTLTQNEMQVTQLFFQGGVESAHALEAALQIMTLCSNATLEAGDPTEVALLRHVEERDAGGVRRRRALCPRVHERPFDSGTREMATVHRTAQGLEALLKGAPEVVIEQCDELRPEERAELLNRADELARLGQRVLALARKSVPATDDLDREVLSPGYAFVALVAMHDPPRPEVEVALRRSQAAGIRVIVISGDHPLTVQAVAREVGIVASPAALFTGADLARWSEAALRRALSGEEILFARTSPMDKLRIVTALQSMGEIVAVTGDGVNDAPALKRADIGVAMGQTGTDVAREAAAVVLMDDNFATIVAAVEEGRVIYGNIRRFVGYVLTSNVPEILPYIAFVLLGIPLPLPVLLILAVDLGTDMAPAIGLATELAEDDVMTVPPRPRSERLLSRGLLLSSYLLWGVLESLAGFAVYAFVLLRGGWRPGAVLAAWDPLYRQAISGYFAAIVLCQVANVLVWRTSRQSVLRKGLLGNRAVVAGVAAELLLLWAIVETGPGHGLFGTASLSALVWLVPVPFALGMLFLSELLKARAARQRGRMPPCPSTLLG